MAQTNLRFPVFVIVLAGVSLFAAEEEESTVVVRQATGAVLLDGSELPRAGIGLWRLEPGSTVESKDGFVELGVGEGAWLRLQPDSSVALLSESADAVRFEVRSGAAVLDVLREPEKAIEVALGKSTIAPDGKASVLVESLPGAFAVLKGKAEARVGGQSIQLKTKTSIPADGSEPPGKLAKVEKDAFADWREERNDEFVREERRANTFAERTIRPAR